MIFKLNGQLLSAPEYSGAIWTKNASGVCTLDVTMPGPLTEEPPFALFATAVLTAHETEEDAGTELFHGTLDTAPRIAEGGAEGWQFSFNGRWRDLDREIYEKPIQVVTYDPETGTNIITLDPTGQVMLGRKILSELVGETTVHTPGHAQIREALEEILGYAAAQIEGFAYELPEEGLEAEVPWEAREDDTLLNALYTILKWSPDHCLVWEGQTLKIVRPDRSAAVTLTAAGDPLIRVAANPRGDLLCERVRIKFEKRMSTAGASPFSIQLDEATGGYEGARKIKKTVYLEAGEPFPEPGIAAEFLAWAGVLHIDAEIPLDEIDLTRDVAKCYKVENALGGLAATPSVCQQIVRDLLAETETLTLGAPRHLGLDDLIALKRKPYRRPDTGDTPQDEPSGTLDIEIGGLPEGLAGEARWSVGEENGSGEASVDLAPGTYNVEFLPVYDFDAGTLYFAPAVEVTIVEDASETATGAYVAVDLAPAQPLQLVIISSGEVNKIRVRPSTIFGQDAVEVAELTVAAAGFVWVAVPFTPSTGEVGTGTLSYGTDIPESTDSSYIVPIGEYTLDGGLAVQNYRFGPITGFPCRNWYADPVDWTLYIN